MDLVERTEASSRRHPWELARLRFFRRVLSKANILTPGRSWLDVGAGDGWFAGELRRDIAPDDRIVCWDINYGPGEISSPDVEMVAERPTERFDVIMMLDVIEHVENDGEFLSGIIRDLSHNDTWLLVSVPAHMCLFTSHDEKLLHYRRYAPAACRHLMEASDLRIVAEGGLFHTLGFVRVVQAIAERLGHRPVESKGVGGWNRGQLVTDSFAATLGLESEGSLRLGFRRLVIPGLSYWALAKVTTHPELPDTH